MEGKGYGIDIGEERKLFDLDFADDIALIDSTNEGLQNCTKDLKEGAAKVGLRFNIKKCEVMTTDSGEPEIYIGTEQVKNTEDFTYLGSKLCNDGAIQPEISIRIGKAGAAFGKLSKIMKAKNILLPTKLKIYRTIVLSILLYGSGTWQIYAKDASRLNAFHQRCLRRILDIPYTAHIRNVDIFHETNEKELTKYIQERRLKWFGHMLRMGDTRFPYKILQWNPDGERKAGRPRLRWNDVVKKDLQDLKITWKEAEKLVQNKGNWRRTARCVKALEALSTNTEQIQ